MVVWQVNFVVSAGGPNRVGILVGIRAWDIVSTRWRCRHEQLRAGSYHVVVELGETIRGPLILSNASKGRDCLGPSRRKSILC